MSSRFHVRRRVRWPLGWPLGWALAACCLGAACQRDEEPPAIPSGGGVTSTPVSALRPASTTPATEPPALDPRALPYFDNAEAVDTGKRLYNMYNCVGCHFNGGGGIGPPLMDEAWTYGGRLDQIYNSIYQGRPNGMPAWGEHLTEEQIWKIAAYVRSMSLPATLEANGDGTPSQHPAPVPRPPRRNTPEGGITDSARGAS